MMDDDHSTKSLCSMIISCRQVDTPSSIVMMCVLILGARRYDRSTDQPTATLTLKAANKTRQTGRLHGMAFTGKEKCSHSSRAGPTHKFTTKRHRTDYPHSHRAREQLAVINPRGSQDLLEAHKAAHRRNVASEKSLATRKRGGH